MNKAHPFKHKQWTLYIHQMISQGHQTLIGLEIWNQIANVESFWGYFYNLMHPSLLMPERR
jgi:hypothetical protein